MSALGPGTAVVGVQRYLWGEAVGCGCGGTVGGATCHAGETERNSKLVGWGMDYGSSRWSRDGSIEDKLLVCFEIKCGVGEGFVMPPRRRCPEAQYSPPY